MLVHARERSMRIRATARLTAQQVVSGGPVASRWEIHAACGSIRCTHCTLVYTRNRNWRATGGGGGEEGTGRPGSNF